MTDRIDLDVHLARDAETGRWYVARSDVPGLWLEADSAAALLTRVEQAGPEMIALNMAEIVARAVPAGGRPVVRVLPVFDSPLEPAIAA